MLILKKYSYQIYQKRYLMSWRHRVKKIQTRLSLYRIIMKICMTRSNLKIKIIMPKLQILILKIHVNSTLNQQMKLRVRIWRPLKCMKHLKEQSKAKDIRVDNKKPNNFKILRKEIRQKQLWMKQKLTVNITPIRLKNHRLVLCLTHLLMIYQMIHQP